MHALLQSTSRVDPRVVVVGAGMGGLLVATFLRGVEAEVIVLRQDLAPGRQRIFPGLFEPDDLRTVGLADLETESRRITQVSHVMRDAEAEQRADVPVSWATIEHGTVLDALAANLVAAGVNLSADLTVTSLVQAAGCVVGVRDDASSRQVDADIVILADESDPRLAEQVGLRPDWLPTQLMHIGKVRFPATDAEIRDRFGLADGTFRVISLRYRSEWGAWGNALLIPGRDSFTLLGAMLLEDEMASARHIREFLDEVEAVPVMAAVVGGFAPDAFFTEVVPIGGFGGRHRFHTDGFLVANDLVGVTHPLNRDGLSLNLRVAAAAAMTTGEALREGSFKSASLAAHSRRITQEITTPAQFRQRQHRRLKHRAPWEWASFAPLVPEWTEVTADGISATLSLQPGKAIWGRVRHLGRHPLPRPPRT